MYFDGDKALVNHFSKTDVNEIIAKIIFSAILQNDNEVHDRTHSLQNCHKRQYETK